jgi:hypothetical protein
LFLLFLARRRPEDEAAPVLATAAGPSLGPLSAGVLSAGVLPAGVLPEEAGMPRWRRPSLRAARAAADRGDLGPQLQLTFREDAAPGVERRRIRYRLVRLSDAPDEVRSAELGRLDQGDEVELLHEQGTFWFVRAPDGTEGWVHRMTLGPLATQDEAAAQDDR